MEILFALLACCAGNLLVNSELVLQRPETQTFVIFFDFLPEQTAEKTIKILVIWDAIVLIIMSM